MSEKKSWSEDSLAVFLVTWLIFYVFDCHSRVTYSPPRDRTHEEIVESSWPLKRADLIDKAKARAEEEAKSAAEAVTLESVAKTDFERDVARMSAESEWARREATPEEADVLLKLEWRRDWEARKIAERRREELLANVEEEVDRAERERVLALLRERESHGGGCRR